MTGSAHRGEASGPRGPADTDTLRPVNPQVPTRPGAPANFRLCANNGPKQVQQGA